MRKSNLFFWFVAAAGSIGVGFGVHAAVRRTASSVASQRTGRVVARLGLTDLALFTEARYTRHPTQADLASAFQDHPLSLEHFPSGSLVPRPPLATGETR